MNIEEMIADAQAEEEIALAQEKARRERMQTAQEPPKEDKTERDNLVTVPLDEYIRLNLLAADFEYMVRGLLNCSTYNKPKTYENGLNADESLTFRDSYIMHLLKLIHPEAYDERIARGRAEVDGCGS